MSVWSRVFGSGAVQPSAAALLEHLHNLGFEVRGKFRGDDQGWFQAELTAGDGWRLNLESYQSREDGLRGELNTWAAWLETAEANPHHGRLMQHVIGTTHLFTLEQGRDEADQAVALALCRFLAQNTAGVYQVDGQGFFDAEGTLLVPEPP